MTASDLPSPASAPSGPGSVLTVMAHPDDAELWAGGTLARLAQTGTTVTIAVPEHPDTHRNTEAARAARELGAGYLQIAALDVHILRDLIDRARPDVVITHPLDDVHPDHRHAATTFTAALPEIVIASGLPSRIYTSDTYNGLTRCGPTPAHTIIDVGVVQVAAEPGAVRRFSPDVPVTTFPKGAHPSFRPAGRSYAGRRGGSHGHTPGADHGGHGGRGPEDIQRPGRRKPHSVMAMKASAWDS